MIEMNLIEKTKQQLLKEGKEIINLSSGIPFDSLIAFPQKVLKKGFENYLKNPVYIPESKGALPARQAIVKYYSLRDLKLDSEQIILTSGTSESYFEIFKMLAEPGEEILFPNPSYPLFDQIAKLAEVKIAFYQLDENAEWQINFDSLISKIHSKTKAIVLISPNNPTASILNEKTLEKVIEQALLHHLPIISDEVFSECIFDDKKFPRIASMTKDLTIFTLSGLSKTYALAGLKLSWIVVTGPEWITQIEELEYLTDTFLASNQISQNLLPGIIHSGEKFIQKYRHYLEENRDLTIRILSKVKGISFHKSEATPYVFVKLTGLDYTDEEFVIALLKSKGIFVHPGYFYDYDEELFFLISYMLEPKKLELYLLEIVDFIQAVQTK